jgi:oligoendopeptidase F
MEFAEVASMSMELLTSPYIGTEYGGFYDRTDAYRSRLQHLDRMLWFLPYMACVSAFQHELYSAGDLSHADRDGLWRRLYLRYNVGADWSGLDETLDSLWHHKLHIFTVPFYYIEYGLAQMGALQVWRQSLSDPRQALDDYRAALALGQTVPLPDLFRRAGADLVFGDESVGELIGLVEDHYAAASEALRAE